MASNFTVATAGSTSVVWASQMIDPSFLALPFLTLRQSPEPASSTSSSTPSCSPKLKTASTTARRPARRGVKSSDRIPRPLNSFMTYRKIKQHEVIQKYPHVDNRDISRIVAEWWRAEPEAVKILWRLRAEEGKLEHYRAYPDYKYQPRKKKDPTGVASTRGVTRPRAASVAEEPTWRSEPRDIAARPGAPSVLETESELEGKAEQTSCMPRRRANTLAVLPRWPQLLSLDRAPGSEVAGLSSDLDIDLDMFKPTMDDGCSWLTSDEWSAVSDSPQQTLAPLTPLLLSSSELSTPSTDDGSSLHGQVQPGFFNDAWLGADAPSEPLEVFSGWSVAYA